MMTPENPGKARIKDIAELAGVSIGTVDRVLHERGEVAEKTRDRILKITRDLNYSPDFIARTLKTKKRLNLASLLPEPNEENTFWSKHPQGMKSAIKELEPFPVALSQVTFEMLDEKDFQDKTRKVLNLHPDGVIMAPLFKDESTEFCKKLTRKKIPFVFVDGYIADTKFLSYTGEDIFQSGRVAGQLTDLVTPPEKDILIINIARNLQNLHHLNNRTKGFLSYFPGSGRNKGKKINLSIPDPVKEKIKKEIGKALAQNQNTGSIFVTGSKSFKVAEYLEKEGIKSINLVGYDLLDRNVEYLMSGMIKFLIGQRPAEQSYKGVKKLFEFLLLNKVPEKFEYLPVDIVTSENVKDFL